MVRVLRSDGQATSACAGLKDLCFERGAEDNLTAVVVHVGTLEYIGDSSHEIPFLEDDAEDTLQTPRFSYGEEGQSEVDLPPAARFEILDDQSETIEFAPEPAETERESSREIESPRIEPVEVADPPPPPPAEQVIPEYDGAKPVESGLLSKVLMAAILLVVGGIIGFGAYYYWSSKNPPVAVVAPTIQEMKTSDIPLTTFEESRRLVDQDPNKYIAANPNPQEAQDYFLLGRAYLLTGEYFKAKNAFNTAKSRLSELDPNDRQTISNEIEMALAIIASGPATEKFNNAISNSTANTAAPTPAR
jgi:hypothetical protein